jgi:HAD superfamily hydrolase (TIGR01509 family)
MRLYIFDFDGTLGDSRGLIVKTMMDTFDKMGIQRPSTEACIATIGLPLDQCFAVSAHLDAKQSEACAEVYRKIFKINNVPGAVKPFPGVIETLKRLHTEGNTLAIASSRRHESLDGLVADFGITDLFSAIVGADDVVNAKPDPEPVNLILSRLHFEPQQAIVIGDAPYDILMGRNAGTKTCAVTWGNGTREELLAAKPDAIIDHPRSCCS